MKKTIKIGLIYFTNTGITGRLMEAACEEVKKNGINCISHQILGDEIVQGRFVNTALMNELKECNAIIFGSPTYMGSVAAQFKSFADATSDFWESQEWSGKVAAGITSGAGLNGDQSSTLYYFITLASQHGMVWVGLDTPYSTAINGINRLGCQLGVIAQSTDGSVHQSDINSAQYLARRVIKIACKLSE